MRLTHTALFALPLLLASCSPSDPKSLTDSGYAAINKGDAQGALSRFDEALQQLGANTSDPMRRKAALGRFQALAKMGDKRTEEEFLAYARSRPSEVEVQDFSLVASELWNKNERLAAIGILKVGKELYPESVKMHELGEIFSRAAKSTGDETAVKALAGIGYI